MRLNYKIINARATLTQLDPTEDGHLALTLDPLTNATLIFGTVRVKIKNGRGRVKLSDVKDGKHTPILICEKASITLPAIMVELGRAKLCEPEHLIADMGERICSLEEERYSVRNEIKRLTDAVFGKKLFEEG